jgi:hypothetical protein
MAMSDYYWLIHALTVGIINSYHWELLIGQHWFMLIIVGWLLYTNY